MNIAIVTYALQVGGIETFIKLLADYFREQGHKVTIIETLTKGKWSRLFEDEGYRVIQILSSALHSRVHHAQQITKVLKRYELIILNDAPFAQSIIGLLPEHTIVIPVLHSNLRSMIQNAVANYENYDKLVAVSPMLKDCAIQFGIDERKVVCIPNGIRVNDKWTKSENDFLREKKLKIIYIGAVNHFQKGVFYLPDIVKSLLPRYPHITLEIIGDGPDIDELKKRFSNISKFPLTFHGALSHEEAMAFLKQSDVLIMPSHFEGFGIVMIEAMSFGVVPIVSRLHGCTDYVLTEGVDGFLVDVGDVQGFAAALLNVATNRSLLQMLSFSCWKTAHDRFSHRVTGASYLQLAELCREERINLRVPHRTGVIDKSLLGDLPLLPLLLVRPVRKVLRHMGLFPLPHKASPVYFPHKDDAQVVSDK